VFGPTSDAMALSHQMWSECGKGIRYVSDIARILRISPATRADLVNFES